MKTFVNTQH